MKIKKYFLTGLVAILPLSLTLYITIKTFSYVLMFSDMLIPRAHYIIRGNNFVYNLFFTFLEYSISIVSAIFLITLIGIIALNYFGKIVLGSIENIISKIPLSRTVYTTIKQISELIFSKESAPYKKVVIVEYPTKGLYSLGFLTNENLSINLGEKSSKEKVKGNKEKIKEEERVNKERDNRYVSVFLPTSPNPTSGFLVILKRERVNLLNISVEDAAKLIISAGAIRPSDLI